MKALKAVVVVMLAFSLVTAFAQTRKKGTEKKPEKPVTLDEKLQMDIDPDAFVYRPMGRRDPFKSLLEGQEASKRGKVEGIAGLTIGELVLEGIVFGKGEYWAYVKGPDNTPYTLRVGDNVYNGKVTEIKANSVVFKQILTVALGGTKEKIVTKYLNPEEEEVK